MALSGTALTETSAFTANVYPPLANSAVMSNDVASGEQALANRTKYLKEDTTGGVPSRVAKVGDTMSGDLTFSGSYGVKYASARTYTRTAKSVQQVDTSIWQPTGTAGAAFPLLAVQSASITPLTLADQLVYVIDPHDGGTITTVTARVKGGSLMGGLPANLPVVTLYRVDVTLGTVTSVGSQTDTSANITAYKLLHTVTISGLSEVVDATKYVYVVRVQGDTGSGGTYGSEFYAPTCVFTRDKAGDE